MTRLFPSAYEGQHPSLPEDPPPYPAHTPPITAAQVGVSVGLLTGMVSTIIRRHSPGIVLRTTARTSAFLFLAWEASRAYLERKIVRPYLEEKGVKLQPRSLVEWNGEVDLDDFIIAGALGGTLLATQRRIVPSVTGWKRLAGLTSCGIATGQILGKIYLSNRFREARPVYNKNRAIRLATRQQLFDKRLTLWERKLERKLDDIQGIPKDESDSADQGLLARYTQVTEDGNALPPGYAPHRGSNVDGEIQWEPNTDYEWQPASKEEGIKELQEHIDSLSKYRQELAEGAEYLWIDLADKEHAYASETDPEQKVIRRKSLELLSSMHRTVYTEISTLDWMIASSKKRIEQLKCRDKWLPRAQMVKFNAYNPQMFLDNLRTHLDHTREAFSMVEKAIEIQQVDEQTKEEVLREVRANIEASARLVDDYERRVRRFGD